MQKTHKIALSLALCAFAFVLFAGAALASSIERLPQSCTYEGKGCARVADITINQCRTIQYWTTGGAIQVQACTKGDKVEVYRNAGPRSEFEACIGSGCVDQDQGFARFSQTTTTATSGSAATNNLAQEVLPQLPTIPRPTVLAGTTSVAACTLLNPNANGLWGDTRSQNYDTLIEAWFKQPNVIQTVSCSQGTCLWVPWYTSSSACTQNELQRGQNCNLPSVDMQNNCLVTDEFSQVGMALAMGTNEQRFQQWVNTVRELKSDKYGQLPVWRASRGPSSINADYTKNQDDASDASARVIIALYTASNSEFFSPARKAEYKSFADTLSADFLKHDFDKTCRPGRGGRQICNWLGSGAATGTSGRIDTTDFSYAGYYGDAVLALLAAYKSTGYQTYLRAAQDTTETYLLAAKYDGGSFKVPPKAFRWDVTGSVPNAVCTTGCAQGTWDDSDAVRAVTLCKARYHAELMGVTLSGDLDEYCDDWFSSGGVKADAYSIQYTFDGKPTNSPQRGFYQNGLAAQLAFHQGSVRSYIDEAVSHFDRGTQTFDRYACMGVYRQAFPIVALGSAIGRDARVFSACDGTQTMPVEAPTQSDVLDLAPVTSEATQPSSAVSNRVTQLQVKSAAYDGGPSSTLVKDEYRGGCRTLQYANSGASTTVLICEKGSVFEMYLQTPSTNGQTVTCVGGVCVGPRTGFARW
jgi:hypothetical protein